jgi:hypothetical protein
MAIMHSYYMGSWNVRRHSGFVGDYLAPSANCKYFVQRSIQIHTLSDQLIQTLRLYN